jgi:DNA-binding response OmpR family regulator
MLTAKGQVFDRARAAKVGADVYITKPFKPREVILLVREALKL